MDSKTIELSRYRMEKAREDLESSEIMLNNEKFAQSLNRSYYAIFHSTRAILAMDRFDSKRHSGIISYFNRNYVKEGKIEIKFGKILTEAQKIRVKSDYDDFYIADKKQAEKQLSDSKEFFTRVKEYLEA